MLLHVPPSFPPDAWAVVLCSNCRLPFTTNTNGRGVSLQRHKDRQRLDFLQLLSGVKGLRDSRSDRFLDNLPRYVSFRHPLSSDRSGVGTAWSLNGQTFRPYQSKRTAQAAHCRLLKPYRCRTAACIDTYLGRLSRSALGAVTMACRCRGERRTHIRCLHEKPLNIGI